MDLKYRLEPGRDYKDVYFMKIDAKGHSTIVSQNDADKADTASTFFEEMVYESVEEACRKSRCQYIQFWGWEGDGGLCILFDEEESKARKTALDAAEVILAELEHINQKISRFEVNGSISVRIAIHKGTIRYKGDDRRGSVHSVDLNWCAHLEKATPANSIAISGDVYKILGGEQAKYTYADGPFEGRDVYIKSHRNNDDIQDEWRKNTLKNTEEALLLSSDVPVGRLGLVGVYSQRALTQEYAQLIKNAQERIWVAGIGLGAFQTDHGPDLLDKLHAGIDIRILGVEPDVSIYSILHNGEKRTLSQWRDWEIQQGNSSQTSNKNLFAFVKGINDALLNIKNETTNLIQYRVTASYPTVAVFIIDSDAFFSTYLRRIRHLKNPTFKVRKPGRLFDAFVNHFLEIWDDTRITRQILP
jgi:class 3 adenylate cyclase